MELLLGSGSPRRKELLENMGIDFRVVAINCDEKYPPTLLPKNIAAYLSQLKSLAYESLTENEILLTADTVVVIDNEVLGKPHTKTEAAIMLRKLSGKVHHVYSAVTLRTLKNSRTITDRAKVFCTEISEEEIEYYISHYHPLDKAGSYGIQEWLGLAKIAKIEGSFFTIMGLPTHWVYESLKNLL